MKYFLMTTFFVALLLCPAWALDFNSGDFKKWMQDYEAEGTALVTEPFVDAARQYHYVFVPGIFNEVLPMYFSAHKKFLKRMGIAKSQISFVRTYSNQTVEQDSVSLFEQLKKIRSRSDKPFVLIAHSKGAAASVVLGLTRPEFFEKNIRALFSIQGAYGGSPVAELMLQEGVPMPPSMGRSRRFLGKTSGYVVGNALSFLWSRGLEDMTREASKKFWERLRERMTHVSTAQSVVSSRLVYVTTERDYRDLASYAYDSFTGEYVAQIGPSDTIVLLKDQRLSWLPAHSCEHLIASHGELVRAKLSGYNLPLIHQFLYAAIRASSAK